MVAVVLIEPKYPHNVGNAVRAASCFGAERVAWTGRRFDMAQLSRLPREERMKGYRSVEWENWDGPVEALLGGGTPVAVEVRENSECLTLFEHPEDAVYVFGPEDGGLGRNVLTLCHRFVHIPSHHCLNLAASVSVVLYDRRMKRQLAGKEPIAPLSEMLREHRGFLDLEEMVSRPGG